MKPKPHPCRRTTPSNPPNARVESLEARTLLSAAIIPPVSPVAGTLFTNLKINYSSIQEAQLATIQIVGPNGYDQQAVFESFAPGIHGGNAVIYSVGAPNNSSSSTWNGGDDGYYTVLETTGTGTVSQVGFFACNLPNGDIQPPTTLLGRRPPLTAQRTHAYTFAIAFNDNTAVSVASLFSSVLITGPGHFSELASAATPVINNFGKQIVMQYSVAAPGGSRSTWGAADNGTYQISILPNSVSDLAGIKLAAGILGTFTIDVPKVADDTPPVAKIDAAPILNRSKTAEVFSISYTDNVAVNGRSIAAANVLIIGRHAFSQPVALAGITGRSTTSFIATYISPLPPPGGYVIQMQPNQVADSAGNFVPAGPLLTFSVPQLPPSSILPAASVNSSQHSIFSSTPSAGLFKNDSIFGTH